MRRACSRRTAFPQISQTKPSRRWSRNAPARVTQRPACWSTPTECSRRCCAAIAPAPIRSTALSKAYTSASFKTDTTALVERSKTVPVLVNLFKLPHLLLLGGGIVIKIGDEVVGAIGAAGAPGGDLHDACANAGLDKIKDQLK